MKLEILNTKNEIRKKTNNTEQKSINRKIESLLIELKTLNFKQKNIEHHVDEFIQKTINL